VSVPGATQRGTDASCRSQKSRARTREVGARSSQRSGRRPVGPTLKIASPRTHQGSRLGKNWSHQTSGPSLRISYTHPKIIPQMVIMLPRPLTTSLVQVGFSEHACLLTPGASRGSMFPGLEPGACRIRGGAGARLTSSRPEPGPTEGCSGLTREMRNLTSHVPGAAPDGSRGPEF